MKATLTELTVPRLKAPERGYTVYNDKHLTGFGVRVTAAGHRSYVLTYGTKRKRVTIGDVGIVKLGEAREKAKGILADYQINGEKPKSLTWSEAKDLYIELHVEQRNKPSTQAETKRLMKRFDTLAETKLHDLTSADVLPIIDRMRATPSAANHHFVAAKGFLNWCVGRQYLPYNPLQSARKPAKARTRDRVLTDEELRSVLATAPLSGSYGLIVLWCLYTLQRRGQIAQLHHSFFDFEEQTITWPSETMKGNRPHTIPYTTLHGNIPDGLVFPNGEGNPWNAWSKPHKAFLKASETAGWNLHDLRRTGATRLAEMGHAPHVVERILAHASGTLTPIALVYNRATYLAEMRTALEAWTAHLSGLQ